MTTTEDPPRATQPQPQPELLTRPTVRIGVYAWALIGVVAGLWVLGQIVALLSIVVIPLILALFPAAVLAPPTRALIRRGAPPALAALVVLVGSLAVLSGLIALLAPQVAQELDGLTRSVQEGIGRLRDYLASGPLGFDPIRLEDLFERAQEQLGQAGGLTAGVFGAVVAVAEGVAGLLFGLVALFFYLKDGPRLAAWLRDLFPAQRREDAARIGDLAWNTIGGYIRGQLLIAFADALLIGIGIAILGVPLALPLAVLVFFGGLFPILGAVVAGAIAVLVALATEGLITALILLAVIIGVQQLEGNVLAPVVLSRATQLHPLATLAALTAGAVLLGVLGAFLAVPVAASATRAVGYLRERVPG